MPRMAIDLPSGASGSAPSIHAPRKWCWPTGGHDFLRPASCSPPAPSRVQLTLPGATSTDVFTLRKPGRTAGGFIARAQTASRGSLGDRAARFSSGLEVAASAPRNAALEVHVAAAR